MRRVVFPGTTGMIELLIAQLILMLFKVLYFDVLKYTFSHFFRAGMHIIIPPHQRRSATRSKRTNNSASFKIRVGISKTFYKDLASKHGNELFFFFYFFSFLAVLPE